ncbi:Vacuolar-sorting receptor 1 [Bienertia sinuspersici]
MGVPMRIIGMIIIVMITPPKTKAIDTNLVHDPCSDTMVQRWDGFTFGLAFSSKESFYAPDQVQLSPCDTRLQLANKAQLAVFRPRVDEISLLTVNSTFSPDTTGGYMVAFAGRKYAARSLPVFVADSSYTVTTFTIVLEFESGILQNLYWKKFGCESCKDDQVCHEKQDCAVPSSKCKSKGGSIDCTISIQLTFSGTDRNDAVLNSWYELKNMRRFSLFNLFASLQNSFNNGFF